MNRAKALFIADRIMTRIETDKAIHKDAIADEIQAGDALDEIVDIISHDGEKWVHRDGTPFDTDADTKPERVQYIRKQTSEVDGTTWDYAVKQDANCVTHIWTRCA